MSRRLTRLTALAVLLGGGTLTLAAQGAEIVPHGDAHKHVNQYVTVEGPVANIRVQRDRSVWLSLGRPYPRADLVIVVPEATAQAIPNLRDLKDATVRVTGQIRPSGLEGPPPITGVTRMPEVSGGRPNAPSILLENEGRLTVVKSAGGRP